MAINLLEQLHETFMLRRECAEESVLASPLQFFLLVFTLSVPFWLLGRLTQITLSADLPVSALIFLVTVIAAVILVYATNGRAGIDRYPYSAERISALISAALAPMVTVAWGPERLPRTDRDVK